MARGMALLPWAGARQQGSEGAGGEGVATGLLKQLQWGSGARAHNNIEAFEYKDAPIFFLFFLTICLKKQKNFTKINKVLVGSQMAFG